MADEEKQTSDVNIAKLKELEKSLAKELDQHVRLSEASDPRLEGTVSVNPSMEQALKAAQNRSEPQIISSEARKTNEIIASNPPTAAHPVEAPTRPGDILSNPSSERKVEDITLTEVDEILNQLDGSFKASMDEIKNEISKISTPFNMESAPIGADYLKDENKSDKDTSADEEDISLVENAIHSESSYQNPESFLPAFRNVSRESALVLPRLAYACTKHLKQIRFQPPKEVFLSLPGAVFPIIGSWKNAVIDFVHVLLSYSATTYLKLTALLILVVSIGFLGHDIISNFRADKERDPFLRSFNDVANKMQIIPSEETGEDLESPLRHPEYMVLIHKIVANLKAPSTKANPMALAEFYLEASNQDCAIEIHDREPEIRDIISRLFEGMSFEEIETQDGKARFKVHIRTDVNRILNHGSVRRIFFKSFNITQ